MAYDYRQAWDGQRAAEAERRVMGGPGQQWDEYQQQACLERIAGLGRTTAALLAWAGDYALALGRKFEDEDLRGENGDLLACASVLWLDAYAGDFDFVTNVRREWRQAHVLNLGALRGVLNCLRADAQRAAQTDGAFRPMFAGVPKMFAAAIESGLKRPMFRARTGEDEPREFVIYPAQRGDRYYVKLNDEFVGFVDQAGEVDNRLERIPAVLDALGIIEADPKAAFAAYGKATGKCGICGRTLSDPESVRAGIGPICAGRMGW